MNDSELSDPARAAIVDGSNRVLVSAVSAWEVTIKTALGKLCCMRSPSVNCPIITPIRSIVCSSPKLVRIS